ncbi:ATP-binding cassette domain-containing protein, partial [Escherichia coli]|uniref:ATP-binding cassette domain-containing protein n=1 Tax=Escherichia coli TaxID=562 RepID=UPI00210CF34E
PLLQLQNVGYLVGDTKILNNINFSLRAGEFKLITGPSGCGKSTLLKIVASLISPTSGTLLFEGEDETDSAALLPCIEQAREDIRTLHQLQLMHQN